MNYQYSVSPYIQAAMAQAFQAIMSGGPLPPNCFVVAIPFQQVQQVLPQLMMGNTPGGGGMMYQQPPLYYGEMYQPQIPYMNNQQANALVPYSNYFSQGYEQNYNYPVVPYVDYNNKSEKKKRHGKIDHSQPHSNVYNSSSFDSHMNDLSWSRLFGHSRRQSQHKDQAALSYDQKSSSSKKPRAHSADSFTTSSSTGSTTTTSDETIRRVNVSLKQPSGSSSLKQQTKGSLPFKYSSEFIPGGGKPKSTKKDSKVKSDDIFVIKKPQETTAQPSSSQQ